MGREVDGGVQGGAKTRGQRRHYGSVDETQSRRGCRQQRKHTRTGAWTTAWTHEGEGDTMVV